MSSIESLSANHLSTFLSSPEGIHEMFGLLGYAVYEPQPIEIDDLELNETDAPHVNNVYILNDTNFGHTIWLYEVSDVRMIRLRGLAYDALQRGGTHLLAVTRDYREVTFVHPYFAGGTSKSHVRVNKLKIIVADPTRHDVDTLNALHAHRRTATDVYKAQSEAFNVTRITKKFYDEYRHHFERARELIVAHNKGIREFQDSDQREKLHAYTQRLLGRLMFLYFLQRKGWLGGQQDFLTRRYRETMRDHTGELGDGETFYYYREVLDPLFFETLNKPNRPDNLTKWRGITIPYLNGGLFDRDRDPAGMILLPDSLFDPNSNEGLLAFFNRYNFTVADDTPLEQDVAVDPEMLGKVFENLLEEDERGQSGSFYTPRTIVSYMCQEALAGYLEESARIPREETRQHFDPDTLINFTEEQAERVGKALDTLTVLDPAVGSGSFLIGMMQEIIILRRAVAAALHQHVTSNVITGWKEQIIRDTLYGVDIKSEAIEIAQLRLWLALVVEQTLEQAHPLPNLDYKLMAGNSLIETIDGEPVLGESVQAMLGAAVTPAQPMLEMFETDKERASLAKLREKYFRASPEERRKLRDQITDQERRIVATSLREKADAQMQIINQVGRISAQTNGKLKASDERRLKTAADKLERLTRLQDGMAKPDYTPPFFLYRLHFSEVFEHGGFGIVVANPPYVRQERISDQKPELEASYPDVYAGTADLFVYFFARACGLLRPKGHLSFITPNKFMRANYGKKLRGFLAGKMRLYTLIDFGDLPIFDATTYPMITLASNQSPNDNKIRVLEITSLDESEHLTDAADSAFILPQKTLSEDGWQLSAPEVRALMDKLKSSGKSLGKYVDGKLYRGIITGLNEAFIIDEVKRMELIASDPKNAEIIKPYLRGRDVKRWRVENAGLYMIALQNSGDADANNVWGKAKTEAEAHRIFEQTYPDIHTHMMAYESKLRPRADQGKWWWELRACAYYAEFEKPKIVYQEIATFQSFAYTDHNFYTNNKCFIIPNGGHYLLAVLNSKVAWFFLSQTVSKLQGGAYAMQAIYLEQFPIPNAPNNLRQQMTTLAKQCLDAAKGSPDKLSVLEAELNALVYQAYGLDEDDIAVIEGYLNSGSAQLADTEALELIGDHDDS